MDYCLACQKPFDEVHPFDFMNDWKCSDMNSDFNVAPDYARGELFPISSYQGLAYRPCKQDHTWREHVQQSYRNRGMYWWNRHIRVPEWDFISDDLMCELESVQ